MVRVRVRVTGRGVEGVGVEGVHALEAPAVGRYRAGALSPSCPEYSRKDGAGWPARFCRGNQ
jgi:hypothetical protein